MKDHNLRSVWSRTVSTSRLRRCCRSLSLSLAWVPAIQTFTVVNPTGLEMSTAAAAQSVIWELDPQYGYIGTPQREVNGRPLGQLISNSTPSWGSRCSIPQTTSMVSKPLEWSMRPLQRTCTDVQLLAGEASAYHVVYRVLPLLVSTTEPKLTDHYLSKPKGNSYHL